MLFLTEAVIVEVSLFINVNQSTLPVNVVSKVEPSNVIVASLPVLVESKPSALAPCMVVVLVAAVTVGAVKVIVIDLDVSVWPSIVAEAVTVIVPAVCAAAISNVPVALVPEIVPVLVVNPVPDANCLFLLQL